VDFKSWSSAIGRNSLAGPIHYVTGDMSGPVENPQANALQIIGNLIRNAFFNAILPGFEGKT
jgi:hypothetical protein